MTTYTVTLSEAENLALGYVAYSQDSWIQSASHERCRVAIEEIVAICVERCLENNIQIPGSKDEMVLLSFEKGWVTSIAERTSEPISGLTDGAN